jgi:hypothetical protein
LGGVAHGEPGDADAELLASSKFRLLAFTVSSRYARFLGKRFRDNRDRMPDG